MKFIFIMKSQRNLMTVSYTHLRREINYLELIINRYSIIHKSCHQVQFDNNYTYNELLADYARDKIPEFK